MLSFATYNRSKNIFTNLAITCTEISCICASRAVAAAWVYVINEITISLKYETTRSVDTVFSSNEVAK